MTWWPPQELPTAYEKLKNIAKAMSFEDFTFEAVVIDSMLGLRGEWRGYQEILSIGPHHLGEDRLMSLAARTLVHRIVDGVLEDRLRVVA